VTPKRLSLSGLKGESDPQESGIANFRELWGAIATALTAFTPDECANYFAACGYNPA
jgi:hypothetical protein